MTAPSIEQAQPYNFRRPHRVSKERQRTLESMYEQMALGLESWLTGRVRSQIEIRIQSIEPCAFGEFVQSLQTPCASFIFDVQDSGGRHGMIDMGQDFSFYLIDRLFGGNGQQHIESRPLTRIERLALRGVVDRATTLLRDVWSEHLQVVLEISAFESQPEILLQSANREDPMLVAKMSVSAGEMQSSLWVALPFTVLDKFFTHTPKRRVNTVTGTEQERAASREIAEQTLRGTRVPVAARLSEFRMTMRDLASLTEGGVIHTALPQDSRVCVRVGPQERFVGTVGRVGNKLAVRITDAVSTDPNATTPAPTASLQFTPNFLPDQAQG